MSSRFKSPPIQNIAFLFFLIMASADKHKFCRHVISDFGGLYRDHIMIGTLTLLRFFYAFHSYGKNLAKFLYYSLHSWRTFSWRELSYKRKERI